MSVAASGRKNSAGARRISIAILAMGGQGGGVLADWVVALAEAQGWAAQSTSVPGVAQRTGATIYYIEIAPIRMGAQPVFALMPTPGDVDVVMASELMEAGRSVLRGLVTPEQTTLIASTHRAFAVGESICARLTQSRPPTMAVTDRLEDNLFMDRPPIAVPSADPARREGPAHRALDPLGVSPYCMGGEGRGGTSQTAEAHGGNSGVAMSVSLPWVDAEPPVRH